MSKIKILPEIVSNKIAAGEVVERPASVVKELVENAIDAGSSKIIVEVEKGGKSLIRVSDNGSGMNRDDALLSIERYATSKIFTDQDLYAINTLGFRGEALPSIAAVSRFTLITQEYGSNVGTELTVQGGKITRVSDAGAPSGTMISVAQLFYNTPARRKFLKTIVTEMGHISDTVSAIALGRPDIRFKLVSDGKTIKDWPSATAPVNRAVDVLGKEAVHYLLPMGLNTDVVGVSGWIADPGFSRSTSRGIYIYVNGRHVRDRVINHALFEGYGQRLMKGKFPSAALFITVPNTEVDVNVHPAKHEVRFSRQKEIHAYLTKAVRQVLGKGETKKVGWGEKPKAAAKDRTAHVSETVNDYTIDPSDNQNVFQKLPQINRIDRRVPQQSLWEERHFENIRVIGQLLNTYILCESKSELVLIDQHAAHERILFEQIKKRSEEKDAGSQRLLVPETIDMGYSEGKILEKLIPDLKKAGIEIEPFGKDVFIVKSVPVILSGRDIKPVIYEIVEKIADIGFAPGIQKTIDTCLILMACHGAIRAHQSLSDEQMKKLISQLEQCDIPSHCPHGRPIYVTWSSKFLEKSFGRTS